LHYLIADSYQQRINLLFPALWRVAGHWVIGETPGPTLSDRS
jgi:hypothetical protein